MKKVVCGMTFILMSIIILERSLIYYNSHFRQIFPVEIREKFYPNYKLSSIRGLIYEMNPHVVMIQDSNEKLFTNSLGFRDKEYGFLKPNNVYRIVAIGDSICYGLGINGRDNVWPKLTERLLNHFSADDQRLTYEVVNCGVIGYNLSQYYINLKEKALQYKPDLVLLSLFVDDLSPTYLPNLTQQEAFFDLSRFLLRESSLCRFIYYQLFWKWQHRPDILKVTRDVNLNSLKMIIELARERNISIVCLFHSTLSSNYDEKYYEDIKNILISEKIPFVSMNSYYAAYLGQKNVSRLSITPAGLDPHPNKQGNVIIANVLYRYLSHEKYLTRTPLHEN